MDYKIISTLDEQQIIELYELYQQEWWTNTRKLEDIIVMLEHTDILIGICDNITNRLIGFIRVLSDFVYKALIFDVIIHEEYQGNGLGRVLLDQVTTHPKLQSVQHLELYCKSDKISLYEKWGFTNEIGDIQLMRKTGK
ncbi:Acetyltransferase (GNAT) family protein [Paenibacillus sophorae]|uniref:Acetyltransferase (GNAT) family protein n=1 Tax=Paenibacillus sophorae TaxID=1333845 RepID=A0A1H8MP04_9BACL|nr:GNAT family N-acetyltransferase [Paenibacillus sophorae]QWU17892.1 GNAT family N-acetyltransferase [Paenibacillus sophorae]SEO19152.1 Acetyltransferase (GNAT) family protein [Paenibacillus sophorae]